MPHEVGTGSRREEAQSVPHRRSAAAANGCMDEIGAKAIPQNPYALAPQNPSVLLAGLRLVIHLLNADEVQRDEGAAAFHGVVRPCDGQVVERLDPSPRRFGRVGPEPLDLFLGGRRVHHQNVHNRAGVHAAATVRGVWRPGSGVRLRRQHAVALELRVRHVAQRVNAAAQREEFVRGARRPNGAGDDPFMHHQRREPGFVGSASDPAGEGVAELGRRRSLHNDIESDTVSHVEQQASRASGLDVGPCRRQLVPGDPHPPLPRIGNRRSAPPRGGGFRRGRNACHCASGASRQKEPGGMGRAGQCQGDRAKRRAHPSSEWRSPPCDLVAARSGERTQCHATHRDKSHVPALTISMNTVRFSAC